jgi:parallel beta-helix repeat protein
MRTRNALLFTLTSALSTTGLFGCGEDDPAELATPPGCTVFIPPGADDQTAVQTALIQAAPGSTVCLGSGTFHFKTELSIDVDGLTVRGAAPGATQLDFSAQDTGSNGILIRSDDVTLSGIDVLESAGDGVRADSVKNVTLEYMSVIWATPESLGNGAYGLYPVNSQGVTINGCLVVGARDAGVYVGQSQGIVVKNNEVYGNVAGIEIENSTDADVYGNYAHDNTGGILVFNLPGLPVKDGKRANVHDNIVEYNNVPNFGDPASTVSNVPTGLGIMVLASDDNEIHHNTITGNDSMGVLVLNYTTLVFPPFMDDAYDPFPQGNWIHDNEFSGNGAAPAGIVSAAIHNPETAGTPVPDIDWDGCTDENATGDALINCLSDNTSLDTEDGIATYLNFDLCAQAGMRSTDPTPVTCTYAPLPISE